MQSPWRCQGGTGPTAAAGAATRLPPAPPHSGFDVGAKPGAGGTRKGWGCGNKPLGIPAATRPPMVELARLPAAAVWYALVALRWAHATFIVHPVELFLDVVLTSWEEACVSAVRESFAALSRGLNGASARVRVRV